MRRVALAISGVAVVMASLGAGTAVGAAPLAQADQDLLTSVKQLSLWELSADKLVGTKGAGKAVKDACKSLTADHTTLGQQVDKVAKQLGVQLPDQPDSDQQGWTAQLSNESGADFDSDYANLLRRANGKVFTAVAAVRAGTNNDLIKQFAQTTVDLVMKDMSLLEATKLVDKSALSDPSLPTTTTQAPAVPPPPSADPQQPGQPQPTQVANTANAAAGANDDRPGPAAILVGLVLIVVLAMATIKIIRRVVNSA